MHPSLNPPLVFLEISWSPKPFLIILVCTVGIRLAVLAHGDYQDAQSTYDVRTMDFTTDAEQLIQFVQSVEATGGGDLPECYEYALRKAQEVGTDR